ncbi:MAG TPA: class I SAM-dependent methyltransferase [Pyrinomonadaceae bacterium]|jgi:2-polyprenyl-3-methyl-5-hydroxy-6-metoxy-1,4-benzoquinol methylase|nr:class I SAM-dependent methyltransferase [Pyrinomonadaceae bacterium]
MTTETIAPKSSTALSKADLFAEKMMNIINGAALALMTSVGHRTNLFTVLSELPPSTAAQIAQAARLNERYVREWLGAMTTGGIVEYDATNRTYTLPPEHTAFLTNSVANNNLAAATQFIPLLASVEDQILTCFRQGGGVPYKAYHRFHEVMAEESSQTVVANLNDSILPLAPGVIEDLRAGIEVLDIGCGSGRAMNYLAERFPRSRFAGYDLSAEAIDAAQSEAARRELTNVRFAVSDVAALAESNSYGLITAFDAIHDQAHPAQVLRAIYTALRPGGTFLMQDIRGSSRLEGNFDNPLAPYLFTISCLHCMTVSLSAGGDGLGAMWGAEKAVEMLGEAGFAQVEVKQLPHDIMNNFYVTRKL